MNKTIKTLTFLAALGAAAIVAPAQTAPKILVVNLAEIYDEHYKTLEQNQKLESDQKKAQEELDRLNAEGNALVAEFKEKEEQSKNPALTDDARRQALSEAQAKLQDIQKKQQEVQQFQQNTRNSLQQRIQTFRSLMLEEISKVAKDIAARKGASLLLDKSGPSIIGVPAVIYADDSYDITAEVKAEINRTKPAGAASAPTGGAAAGGDSAPKINVPGASPKR